MEGKMLHQVGSDRKCLSVVETGRIKGQVGERKAGPWSFGHRKEMGRFLRKIVEENVVCWKSLFVGKFCLPAPSPLPAVCSVKCLW